MYEQLKLPGLTISKSIRHCGYISGIVIAEHYTADLFIQTFLELRRALIILLSF